MACLFCLLPPLHIFAHATLMEANPSPDSHWETPPTEVVLTFNERLENRLFYIRVLDSRGEAVTSKAASMSEGQSRLTLNLPKLSDGIYTVTYKVISADGHPVEGAYVITVGDAAAFELPQNNVHLSHEHELSGAPSLQQILLYTSRFVYFLSLLCMVGWTFWGIVVPPQAELLQRIQATWSTMLQRIFLLSLVAMIATHLPGLLHEWTAAELLALLGTTIGISWLASLTLSVIGFFRLHRHQLFDAVWIVLLLAAKSINGHAMAFEPQAATVASNWIHLSAAAVWAGGLLYLVILWRKNKEQALQFLPCFSNAALITIMILTISGIVSTLLFLPQLEYIMFTQWGTLLRIKIALILLVIIVGGLFRLLIKRRKAGRSGLLLKADFSLMVLIVAIVGIFTYANPLPANGPLYWHQMDEKVHVSAVITPNMPGAVNDFQVIVWLPEELGEPKRVQLRLKYQNDAEVAPIDVPIYLSDDTNLPSSFPGFGRFDYFGHGPYVPFPGRWEVEVRVMDANDDEKVHHTLMTVY